MDMVEKALCSGSHDREKTSGELSLKLAPELVELVKTLHWGKAVLLVLRGQEKGTLG